MLDAVRADESFQLEEVDIATSEDLEHAYRDRIPVVTIDGVEAFWFRVDARALTQLLKQKPADD